MRWARLCMDIQWHFLYQGVGCCFWRIEEIHDKDNKLRWIPIKLINSDPCLGQCIESEPCVLWKFLLWKSRMGLALGFCCCWNFPFSLQGSIPSPPSAIGHLSFLFFNSVPIVQIILVTTNPTWIITPDTLSAETAWQNSEYVIHIILFLASS